MYDSKLMNSARIRQHCFTIYDNTLAATFLPLLLLQLEPVELQVSFVAIRSVPQCARIEHSVDSLPNPPIKFKTSDSNLSERSFVRGSRDRALLAFHHLALGVDRQCCRSLPFRKRCEGGREGDEAQGRRTEKAVDTEKGGR